jgi:hypothetical protein
MLYVGCTLNGVCGSEHVGDPSRADSELRSVPVILAATWQGRLEAQSELTVCAADLQ